MLSGKARQLSFYQTLKNAVLLQGNAVGWKKLDNIHSILTEDAGYFRPHVKTGSIEIGRIKKPLCT